MVGRYVIPHFNDKNNVVRPTEDILETIRAMRPQKPVAASLFRRVFIWSTNSMSAPV